MLIRLCLACAVSLGSAAAADYPEVQLTTPALKAKIFLPDAKAGFYRGLRFDWSGMIGSLEAGGHNYYGPWFNKFDASVRDFEFRDGDIVASSASAATGPAEEFQTPQGYDAAKPGGTFVKVGVGVLRKPDETAYSQYKLYELVDHGKWSVKHTNDSIEFTQVLDSPASDYKYVYTKTIRLMHDKPEMLIEHTLRNTGTVAIQTRLYDHNFLKIEGAAIGPEVSVTLPFEIKPTRPADPQAAKIDGSHFVYMKTLEDKDRVSSGLQGFGTSPADYDVRIENRKVGAGVRIRGDKPLNNLSLWSIRSVMAVEPFIEIAADPGKDFSWNYTYDYYSVPQK